MKPVIKILGLNKEAYELLVMDMFFEWCDCYAASRPEIKKLISNQSLLNWYVEKLQELEAIFLAEITEYGITEPTVLMQHYHRVTECINNNYPRSILQRARRTVLNVDQN